MSGGLVWTLYRTGVQYALSAANGHVVFQATLSGITHFSAPSSGSHQVFVAANGGITSFHVQARQSPAGATSDFNGDGKSDIAVFRPSTGGWYISLSGGGGTTITPFRANGDHPIEPPLGS